MISKIIRENLTIRDVYTISWTSDFNEWEIDGKNVEWTDILMELQWNIHGILVSPISLVNSDVIKHSWKIIQPTRSIIFPANSTSKPPFRSGILTMFDYQRVYSIIILLPSGYLT